MRALDDSKKGDGLAKYSFRRNSHDKPSCRNITVPTARQYRLSIFMTPLRISQIALRLSAEVGSFSNPYNLSNSKITRLPRVRNRCLPIFE